MLNAALIGSIAASNAVDAQPVPLPEDEPLPTPLATIAGTTGNFNTLLGSGGTAQPGARINLANGSYGDKTIAVSGTQANPIQVRATTLHGAVFTRLLVTGNHVIVSGVDCNKGASVENGSCIQINGSNCRVTRSLLRNGGYMVVIGSGATDILIDHCEIHRSRNRMFWLSDPKDQQRITVARCWCHELLAHSSSPDDASMGFVWSDQNIYREKHTFIVVRLNYIGPGTAPVTFPDYVHDKVSGTLYAFNRLDSTVLWEMRFGLRKRMVGCYLPSAPITTWDDLGWYFGNKAGTVRAPAGRSHYYDDTKNLASAAHNSVGGFHACKRARFAGNEFSSMILGAFGNIANWCTGESPDPTTLPDPLGAGGIKGARSLDGITYAADNPADPDVGIKIRAHSGTITEETAACIDWAQNINSLPGSAAPASWLSELLAEHPWIEDICPDPTSLTGGSGSTAPWAVAQALTRGDASNPNTGPFRDTAGGLP